MFDYYYFLILNLFFSFSHAPERSPPIEEVIRSGVVPRFVEFLLREDYPQLQVCFGLVDVMLYFKVLLSGPCMCQGYD